MSDPFQDVDAAGPEFIKMFADSMDVRQSDPSMEKIVATYLSMHEFTKNSHVIEVGAGAGAVTRRIAAYANPAKVTGFDPSVGFVKEARDRAKDHANLTFVTADGAELPLESGSCDAVIMHTVLSHVLQPETLIQEAVRVLKPKGTLTICDADFSKASLANFPNDPLDMCAREFASGFVTDPYIVGKLRGLISDAGLKVNHFGMEARLVITPQQMRPWVEVTTKQMFERGDIGSELAVALLTEHDRRAANGLLYGYQTFATVVGQKL